VSVAAAVGLAIVMAASDPVPATPVPIPDAAPEISEPVPGEPASAPASDANGAARPESATGPQASATSAEQPAGAGSEIVVTAREEVPGDPLVELNAQSYEAIQAVDRAVIGPIAMGYQQGMPKPLRLGLRNFLRNLEEPVIAFNYLLQLKPARAAKSVARFAVNSTIGVAGLVDVAKNEPFNLPYTPNGFANTFACYGIGPGPYFFLPLVGPTTLRDVIGVGLDRLALPAVVGKPLNKPYYAIPANVIDSLNDRIDIDQQLNRIREETADPYAASRDLYLRQRKAEIAAICPKKGEKAEQGLPPRPGKGED
jgi:phospholipid-binding lipoprotein MlaA